MILVNGTLAEQIDIADRGLQYGDGVFETIAFRQQQLELLEAHLKRLQLGCMRLQIPFDDFSQLEDELQQLCDSLSEDAVVKIIITRGKGGRGYAVRQDITPSRILSTHAMPKYPACYAHGIKVRFCQHRLSTNPVLAGIKHLNRLDQVIARNEWQREDIAEGLMLDQQGQVIEGTMSNLFVVKSEQLLTPSLTTSGIAGVMREYIMQLARQSGLTVIETDISVPELLDADELFVCNSLIGIWPVVAVLDSNHVFPLGPVTRLCQSLLKQGTS